jgi:hypothetical protein
VGPIAQLAGLEITANGQRVEWVRDTLHPFAFHIDVPAGATVVAGAGWFCVVWLFSPTEGLILRGWRYRIGSVDSRLRRPEVI